MYHGSKPGKENFKTLLFVVQQKDHCSPIMPQNCFFSKIICRFTVLGLQQARIPVQSWHRLCESRSQLIPLSPSGGSCGQPPLHTAFPAQLLTEPARPHQREHWGYLSVQSYPPGLVESIVILGLHRHEKQRFFFSFYAKANFSFAFLQNDPHPGSCPWL